MKTFKNKSHMIAFMGIFLAFAIVLNIAENLFPPITALPPGIKLGLSNIVTMYCLFFVGKWPAVGLATLKSVFVLLIRGFTAGLLSFSGGLCAILVMILLMLLFGNKPSYYILSVAGGISHNLGQLAVASLILQTPLIVYYLPILIVGGIIAGTVTAAILKVIMPALKRLNLVE